MSILRCRLLFIACMIFSFALVSGCGRKPVEPYQSKTATNKPEATDNSIYSSGSGYDAKGPAGEEYHSTDSSSYPVENKSGDSFASSLPTGPSSSESQEKNGSAPLVEPLDAGSKANETQRDFADHNSDDYKRKNGRSSPQMKSVYYDFDQFVIRNDQIPKMEANAQYLKKNQANKVVIEGNCDERGTNEYNLALGERRASSAKKYLEELGVQSSRIRTISYGEERPLFPGSEESDYALNRRSDFVLE